MRKKFLTVLIICGVCFIGYIFCEISSYKVYQDISEISSSDVALVLGTGKFVGNERPNKYYWGRIEAAAKLYKIGKVKSILVSGDNSSSDYNEPETMKEDLIDKGVPEDSIICDYAGLRTLDSVRRAKNVFGIKAPIIVTQYYHAKRALFLCDKNNIKGASAFEAPADVPFAYKLRNNSREALAWVKAWIDIYITKKQAKFEK